MNTTITTKDQARQYAIDWQAEESKTPTSWQEYAKQVDYLNYLAEKFDLVEEFTENGII